MHFTRWLATPGRMRRRLARFRRNVIIWPRARAFHRAKTIVQNCVAGRPISSGMHDPQFKARFVDVPAIIDDWVRPYASLKGAHVLDFGCGEGVSALGVGLGFGAARV